MKILIDTNIMLDLLTVREPFFRFAKAIFELCDQKKIEGYIAAHSFTKAYYILRKHKPDAERRTVLLKLCEIVSVAGVDESKITGALKRDGFSDFEDCVQDECAAACGADFIITKNVGDFERSRVKAVTPEEFLKIYEK